MDMERNNQISPTGRLGVREPEERGTDAIVAWHCATESHLACGCTSGHLQKIRLAYLSTYVLDSLDCQWRERQGCAGVDASRKQPLHPADLQSGTNQNEEGCTESISGSTFGRRNVGFPAHSRCQRQIGKASIVVIGARWSKENLVLPPQVVDFMVGTAGFEPTTSTV